MAADGLKVVNEYGGRPSYGELAAVVLAGAGHVLVELGLSDVLAIAYNVAVSLGFVAYVVWRIRRTPGVLRIWGFRGDNFGAALRAQFAFVAVGAVLLFALAAFQGTLTLPPTFWLTLLVYPVWGIAQQFALQNLIARNLARRLSPPFRLAGVAATLFAVSHYPRLELVALTFGAGVVFTLIYRAVPNLWAVGIAHGWLGALAFYLVLQEDPGAVMLRAL